MWGGFWRGRLRVAAIGDTGLWGQAYSPIGEKDRFVLPAFARKKIRESSGSRILCLAKHGKYTCLSGFGLGRTDDLQKQLEREEDIALQRGEEFETDARAAQLFGFSEIGFDDSGRFSLPEHLMSLAGVEDGLYFHGGGKTMTVWSPARLFDMDSAWDHAKVTCRSLMEAADAKAKKK